MRRSADEGSTEPCRSHRHPATELRLEVVQVPVSDVDRAKAFYTDHFGFHLDHWGPIEACIASRVSWISPPYRCELPNVGRFSGRQLHHRRVAGSGRLRSSVRPGMPETGSLNQ
ncbi:VOC family protein [Arthrobacter sp. ES1]|uniref:VOC family protein n=1 Tax=Arthrobacter sp. ES1 TaxID=1897056 RepID=UPI0037C0E1EB